VISSARRLRNNSIDLIFTSPFGRTKKTAILVAQELGISEDKIIEDGRLVEWNVGKEFNNKPLETFFAVRNKAVDRYAFKTEDGESYSEVFKRTGNFIYEIDKKYSNKNILIISHGK
jgi:broad specificity phosphatase PhoE